MVAVMMVLPQILVMSPLQKTRLSGEIFDEQVAVSLVADTLVVPATQVAAVQVCL